MTWKTVKLGDVCDFEGGSQPPKKEFVHEEQDGYVRFIQIRDFKSDNNLTYIPVAKKNRLCRADDILIGRYGASVGKILTGLEGAYNVALMKTTPNEELISKGWLFAYLRSPLFQIPLVEVSSRSAQDGFSKADIYNFELPLPPLAEQKSIVAKLDKAFEEIDKAIKSVERKEIEFEKLKNSTINDLIGLNNESYQNFKLKDVCIIKPPKREAKEKLNENTEVSFMGMDMLGINQLESSSEDFRKLSSVYNGYTYFAENDVLLAKITPCFENGKLGIAKRLKNGVGFGSSEFIVFRCKEDLSPQYLYYYLNQKSFRDEGKKNMTGAVGHKRVSKEFIENSIIKIPSLQKQKIVISKLEKINNEINNIKNILEKSCKNYKALRSSILRQELQQDNAA